ncbi:hypothetical protein FA95DRAFT_223271 [Auriscalpium vulgare]|uniref:Uncharacterized protein n=1 Tax=Auriscalpium vulgare TaxID=40419 RepID=A0ACB8RKR7_9AGAM|nr:hypothetical protein FA95DRAFT_223271 [Auriscalpium vulgare]
MDHLAPAPLDDPGVTNRAHTHAARVHNAEQPIARIPPETLADILSILCLIDPPSFEIRQTWPETITTYRGWLCATYVCQRWRHVALDHSALWANITLPHPFGRDGVDTFISRAQDVPLTITYSHMSMIQPDYSMASDRYHSRWDLIEEHLARVRVLDLHLYHTDIVIPRLHGPAPHLHTLNVCFNTRTYGWHRPSGAIPKLPDSLLGGPEGAPALQHLRVCSDRAANWSAPRGLLTRLVSLDLAMRISADATLTETFETLGELRQLQRITLQLDISHHVRRRSSGASVTLPAARDLRLHAKVADARVVLARLAFQVDIRVCCEIPCSEDSAEAEQQLPELLRALAACTGTRSAATLRVNFAPARPLGEAGVDLLAWRSADTQGPPALTLRLHCAAGSPQHDAAIVLPAFCSDALEELAASGDVPTDAWLDALSSARGLRRVVLKGGAVRPFCDALHRTEEFLPALCTLVLARADFEEASQAPAPDGTVRTLADTLALGLAARAQAGHALKELVMLGCTVDNACARRLQDAVPAMVIRWRGEEGEGCEGLFSVSGGHWDDIGWPAPIEALDISCIYDLPSHG